MQGEGAVDSGGRPREDGGEMISGEVERSGEGKTDLDGVLPMKVPTPPKRPVGRGGVERAREFLELLEGLVRLTGAGAPPK